MELVVSVVVCSDLSAIKLDKTLEAVVTIAVRVIVTPAVNVKFFDEGAAKLGVTTKAPDEAAKTVDRRGPATVV